MARSARSSRRQPRQILPAESILGPAPLFEGEDRQAYEELLKHVRAAIKPPNILVDLSVCDIVYHTWSIVRYQRYELELAKKLDESEKIYRTDPLTELSITVQRMKHIQQLISIAEQRRLKAFKQIEYICTKFAKALRKAIAEAEAQLSESIPSGSEPGAKSGV
jgi:hypothetical protein